MTPGSPRRTRKVFVLGAAALAVLVIGAGATTLGALEPRAPRGVTTAQPSLERSLDGFQAARIAELRSFTAWLDEQDARGFVGEVGWPDDDDWNALAEAWYSVADRADLQVTAWAAGSWWPADYPLTLYGSEGGERLDRAYPQASVVEASRVPGVNVAGLEFGTESEFSAADPGVFGTDYRTEAPESYVLLAERGIQVVRLPFRWERLQPEVGGDLDLAYLELIRSQLDAAEAAGIEVVLDLHNYGVYQGADGPELLRGAGDADPLIDVWVRVDEEFGDHPAVSAYGLMNEPHDLDVSDAIGAAGWEELTRAVVTGLRDEGVEAELLIAGYDWSSLARWRDTHPDGWIDDPLDRFRYEAHHYWDQDGSGGYERDYADEAAAAG